MNFQNRRQQREQSQGANDLSVSSAVSCSKKIVTELSRINFRSETRQEFRQTVGPKVLATSATTKSGS
jgi:hypothetical protein